MNPFPLHTAVNPPNVTGKRYGRGQELYQSDTGDLARASQVQTGMPESVGMMTIKTANLTILEASQQPAPRALWKSFWYEGELSCLFADSNVGKSILAVQIADRIARTTMCCIWTLNCPKSSSSSAIPTSMESSTPFPTNSIGCLLTATSFWMPTLRKLS